MFLIFLVRCRVVAYVLHELFLCVFRVIASLVVSTKAIQLYVKHNVLTAAVTRVLRP